MCLCRRHLGWFSTIMLLINSSQFCRYSFIQHIICQACSLLNFNFANLLADGTSASTRAVWLSTLMVILILSTSSYIAIGYHGQIMIFDVNEICFMESLRVWYLYLFFLVVVSVIDISIYHTMQGNETKRSIITTLLEKGG